MLCDVSIGDPTAASVIPGLLQKRHSDAKHNTSDDLAAGSLLAHYGSNIHDTRETIHPYLGSQVVNPYLAELCTKRVERVFRLLLFAHCRRTGRLNRTSSYRGEQLIEGQRCTVT